MKKFVVFSLTGLLIMALSATVYAQKLEFRASGYLDVLSIMTRNVPEHPYETSGNFYGNPFGAGGQRLYPPVPGAVTTDAAGGAFDRKRAYMESRCRLKFDAIMSPNLMGTIWLEIDSLRWGERTSGYGGSINDQRQNAGAWGADAGAVEVKNLNITFGVPGIPIPVQVVAGITPMAYRPHILAYVDATGIETRIKLDPANIKLSWFKALENQDYSADDVDFYGGDISVKAGPVTIGGFGLHMNANTYPFPNPTVYTLTAAGALIAATTTPTVNTRAQMTWLGLYADGKLGPVTVNFDLVFNTGKVEDHRDVAAAALFRDVDYRGWATMLQLDYPWEKFNFGLIALYASGADADDTFATGLPGTVPPGAAAGVTSDKVGAYMVVPGAEVGVNDMSMVFYGTGAVGVTRGAGSGYLGLARGQIGGTWAAKLYGSYKATPWYKIILQGLYIGDTTANGNTVGTARVAPYGAGDLRNDKTIGWELDMINEIQVYKNLKFFLAGGVLFAGDAMDQFVNAANPAVSPKNPWAIYTKLAYSF